jgi:hypothetical protein
MFIAETLARHTMKGGPQARVGVSEPDLASCLYLWMAAYRSTASPTSSWMISQGEPMKKVIPTS